MTDKLLTDKLLMEVIKFYSQIASRKSDEFGIPLLEKNGKTLYIRKVNNYIHYYTKGKEGNLGIDNCFKPNDVFVAVGQLNSYIPDMKKKEVFFNAIMQIRTDKENKNEFNN